MKLNEIKDVQCKAQYGKWSDWIETEDSNCTFNENKETWTKKATRTCSPDPLFGGICQGRINYKCHDMIYDSEPTPQRINTSTNT